MVCTLVILLTIMDGPLPVVVNYCLHFQLVQAQADYHRTSLELLERLLPQITEQIGMYLNDWHILPITMKYL